MKDLLPDTRVSDAMFHTYPGEHWHGVIYTTDERGQHVDVKYVCRHQHRRQATARQCSAKELRRWVRAAYLGGQ